MNLNKNNKQTDYTNRERTLHMSWCLKNDIKIYFKPIDYRKGQLVIEEKGRRYITDEVYIQPTKYKPLKSNQKKWWLELKKLYTSKFLEYNK